MTKRHRPRPPRKGIAAPAKPGSARVLRSPRARHPSSPRPIEIPLPPGVLRGRDVGQDCRAFSFGRCWCLLWTSGGMAQLVVGHGEREPTLGEVRAARLALVPSDVMMAMLVPPRSSAGRVSPFVCDLVQVSQAGQPAARSLLVGPDGQPIRLEVAGA